MTIPLVDLNAQYNAIKTDIDSAILRVISRSSFIGGEEVRSFESEFANYCGAQNHNGDAARSAKQELLYCASCGNGTDAVYLTLRALGIGAGDEVITVAHTFIATAEAISATGARPVFVDVDPVSYTMDPAKVEAAITSRTRAILPVHLYGNTADMDALLAIAKRHNLL